MDKKEKPEVYFIRYAYPCSHILCDVRGEVSKEDFQKMERAAISGTALNRKFLEKAFHRAFKRITPLAKEMGKDAWDLEVIKEYFTVRHNPVLAGSDYPESFKEMCRTYRATVISPTEDGEIIVSYSSEDGVMKKRKVKKDYFPDLKVGDRVWIHWMYAVEKI